MFGPALLAAPSLLHVPLLGREHLARAAHGAAVSLCEPYKGSKRYKQMVEYYSWRIEHRWRGRAAYQASALVHDAAVAWLVAAQLARAAEAVRAVLLLLAAGRGPRGMM